MTANVERTIATLRGLAQQHERVAVAFSGGKDSMATLELATRFFSTVFPFYWYWVPGLRCDAERLAVAKDRWGLDVLQYPHYKALESLATMVYCDPVPELAAMPKIDRRMLFDLVKSDSGATLILTGEKKADGFWRRRRIAARKERESDVLLPLKEWTRWEVLNFCKSNRLAVVEGGNRDNSGVNLSTEELLHLHDRFPDDFAVLRSYFPYIDAIVVRRELYGLTTD